MNDLKSTDRLTALHSVLRDCESVVVAFSGGVDSTLVVCAAVDVLGANVLAVTGKSLALPAWELDEAVELAADMGVRHRILDTEELSDPGYAANGSDRCYFCKNELFGKLEKVREGEGLAYVVDGTNTDDLGDHRPGSVARDERGVRSPLVEAGCTKADVRTLSRHYGLSTAEKPAFACLASRFPYGTAVTAEGLERVAAAEGHVRDLGFRQFRVRHHGDIARLELDPVEIDRALSPEVRQLLVRGLKNAGYRYVALDLEGYRSGSLNDMLPATIKRT